MVLFTCRAMAADTLLVLGDSLSAGYRMAANTAWPALLNDKWQAKTTVVNASISGDTSQQGLARLPALLKQHQPRWVLVELGGNDGLRGFPPQQTEQTLRTVIQDIKAAKAQPLLMQIRLPTMGAVIMKPLARFIRSWPKSSIFLCCPFLWRRFISSHNGCRTTAFILIAMRNRLLPTGWQPGWLP